MLDLRRMAVLRGVPRPAHRDYGPHVVRVSRRFEEAMTPEEQAEMIVDSVLVTFGLDRNGRTFPPSSEEFDEMRAYAIRSVAQALGGIDAKVS